MGSRILFLVPLIGLLMVTIITVNLPADGYDISKGGKPESFAEIHVSIAPGSAVPGCEETNECYIPYKVNIKVGETVTWTNKDTAGHTVTSGTPEGGPDGKFDSLGIAPFETFSYTFNEVGTFDYFCIHHPWMTGIVEVQGETLPEKGLVPQWIKNNALWWSENQISDDDFVLGIQWLINNGLIIVEEVEVEATTDDEIPEWIKRVAGFWAEDKITDREFLDGIQFLIKVGIINMK